MAKASSTDLLEYVLQDLNELLDITKKSQKEAAESNVPPSTIGKVLSSNGGINNIAASLNTISSIKLLSRVKKEDVEHVAELMKALSNSIKGLQMTKEDAEAFNRLVTSFSTITKVFGDLSGNLFSSFRKFSPLKGKIIGKRLGQFYKALLKGFESEKLGKVINKFKDGEHLGNNLAGFSTLIATLFAVDWKQMMKIGVALAMFPDSAGKNLANFFKPIIDIINKLPKDIQTATIKGLFDSEIKTFQADSRIKSFMDLFNMFAAIPLLSIRRIKKLGTTLNKELATGIVEFFTEIITMVKKEFKDNKTFKGQLNSFMELFTLFASIPAMAVLRMVLMGKLLNKKLGWNIGEFISGIIEKINKSSEKDTKNAISVVKAVSLLIGILTLSLITLVAVVALAKTEQIIGAGALLVALVVVAIGTIWVLSKIKKQAKQSIETAASISLMILALSVGLLIFAGFAKIISKIKKEDAWRAVGIMAVVVIGIGLVIFLAGKIKEEQLQKGLIGIAGITAALLGLTTGLTLFGGFMIVVSKLSGKDIAIASAIALGIIACVIGIMIAAAACISGPQAIIFAAGLAAGASLSAAIAMISGSLLLFTKFIYKVKGLTEKDIEHVCTIISGNGENSMMGCLKTIITSLAKFGPFAAIKVGIIGASLFPVFESLSTFVDVIQKMANMQIVDHYEKDKNGNQIPIYRKMTNKEFLAAATTLSIAFTLFMNKLYSEFNSKDKLDLIQKILKTFSKGNVGELMIGLGSFSKAIIDFASLQVPDKWDNNGVAIHYTKLAHKDFETAATTLASAFATFITTLQSEMKNNTEAIPELLEMFKGEGDNTVLGLIDAVSHCIDPLAKLAAGKWGNDDKTKIDKDILVKSVDTLISPITSFISNINANEEAINKAIKLRWSIRNISADMVYVGNKFAELKSAKFIENTKKFKEGSFEIFSTLDKVKDTYEKKADIYEASLKSMASGLKKLIPQAKDSWKPMSKNATALQKFNDELISKRDERNQAMTEIASNFKSMAETSKLFNDSFKETLDLFREYLDYKTKSEHRMWGWFSRNTKETFEDVGRTISQSAEKMSEAVVNDKSVQQQPVASGSNAELVNAITGALSAWSTTAKNVTLELSDSGVKALGKVYLK